MGNALDNTIWIKQYRERGLWAADNVSWVEFKVPGDTIHIYRNSENGRLRVRAETGNLVIVVCPETGNVIDIGSNTEM